ncbi:MAG TPA: hypothetical protein VKA41_11260 [Solirubrobacterales bacterium]|nr:hypothetical protein [Solirubrobacterales bacterium]
MTTRQHFKGKLRYLTPILRPIFRWNHNWSAARAKEGLEPDARRHLVSGPAIPAK